MKKIILTVTTFANLVCFGANFNQPKTLVRCVSNQKKTEVKVVDYEMKGLRLLVLVNSNLVFNRKVLKESFTDRTYFVSEEFNNENGAPTKLRLQTYEDGNKLVGDFHEVFYVPQTNTMTSLICK